MPVTNFISHMVPTAPNSEFKDPILDDLAYREGRTLSNFMEMAPGEVRHVTTLAGAERVLVRSNFMEMGPGEVRHVTTSFKNLQMVPRCSCRDLSERRSTAVVPGILHI